MKRILLVMLLAAFIVPGLSGTVKADIFVWQGGVEPNDGPPTWENLNNWMQNWAPATSLPAITGPLVDSVYMVDWTGNGVYAEVTQPGTEAGMILIGSEVFSTFWQFEGGLVVQSGGVLTTNRIDIGIDNSMDTEMIVNGGTVNVSGSLNIGSKDGMELTQPGGFTTLIRSFAVKNTLSVISGSITVGDTIQVNTDWGVNFDGGRVDIYGGEVITNRQLSINHVSTALGENPADTNFVSDGGVNIYGGILRLEFSDPLLSTPGAFEMFRQDALEIYNDGKLLLKGDRTDTAADQNDNVLGYIAVGVLSAGNGGELVWDYNVTTPGYTTITVQDYIGTDPNTDPNSPVVATSNCIGSILPGDLSDDCVENFFDFVIFSEKWLDCAKAPSSFCP